MKKILKWSLLSAIAAIGISSVAIAILIHQCNNPETEPIPQSFTQAAEIWTTASKNNEVSIQIDEITLHLEVDSSPTIGTTVRYSDEDVIREAFPYELYFGATDVRYHSESGIVFVKVAGRNAVCGPTGERIFEFDVRQRVPQRNYWVSIHN